MKYQTIFGKEFKIFFIKKATETIIKELASAKASVEYWEEKKKEFDNKLQLCTTDIYHNKYSTLFEHRDTEDDYYEHSYLSGFESVLPTLIAVSIVVTFLLSGIVSYALTKEVSADGTHTHWTWFRKYMINEDGHFRSHHFAHPDKCAICKQITKETNESKESK